MSIFHIIDNSSDFNLKLIEFIPIKNCLEIKSIQNSVVVKNKKSSIKCFTINVKKLKNKNIDLNSRPELDVIDGMQFLSRSMINVSDSLSVIKPNESYKIVVLDHKYKNDKVLNVLSVDLLDIITTKESEIVFSDPIVAFCYLFNIKKIIVINDKNIASILSTNENQLKFTETIFEFGLYSINEGPEYSFEIKNKGNVLFIQPSINKKYFYIFTDSNHLILYQNINYEEIFSIILDHKISNLTEIHKTNDKVELIYSTSTLDEIFMISLPNNISSILNNLTIDDNDFLEIPFPAFLGNK